MDDSTLQSLRTALAANPENRELALVVGRALLERGSPREARAVLDGLDLTGISKAEDRRLVARILLAAGEPAAALPHAGGDEAEAHLLRARILLALERTAEAKDEYKEAVTKNPTLEDLELAALLRARVHEPVSGGPRLKVIANDDTREQEAARLFQPPAEKVTFADVGGLDEVKRQIQRRIILPFTKPSLFQRFKKRVGGGILLYGPPGCGKTLLARATAGECNALFLNVAISDVLDMYIGESERKLHAVFEKARSSVPAVLFFDELEALAGKRQYTRESTSSKLVSQFLSEMDGFTRNNSGVLVLGATNVPWAVDSAFRRPGRFDRVLFVPPPDRAARLSILQQLLDARPTASDVNAQEIADATSGCSGADLENLVETASDQAIEESLEKNSETPICRRHLLAAVREVKPTTLEWLTTARNYARYANESGHYDEVLAFLEKHGKS